MFIIPNIKIYYVAKYQNVLYCKISMYYVTKYQNISRYKISKYITLQISKYITLQNIVMNYVTKY